MFLAVTYEKPAGEFARRDISYTVELSTDLQTWTVMDSILDITDTDQENIKRVTTRSLTPVGRSTEYLRVRVNK